MARADDEIPDLLSGASKGASQKQVGATASPRPQKSAEPSRAQAGGRSPIPVVTPSTRSRTPPAVLQDRPSSDGLELAVDVYDTDDEPSAGRATQLLGSNEDPLEFDPISTRGADPNFAGDFERARAPQLSPEHDLELSLDIAGTNPFENFADPARELPTGVPQRRAAARHTPPPPELDFDDPEESGVPSSGRHLDAALWPSPSGKASHGAPDSAARALGGDMVLDIPEPKGRSSVPPSAAPPAPARGFSSFPPPPVNVGHFPAMAGDLDLGDGLDDLDFGGAAAAQLNVAIPMPERGDDVPWPNGRTPYPDELSVSREEAKALSGFGSPPENIFQTPFYTLRVLSALKPLREKCEAAKAQLFDLEQSRDAELAQMAETKRGELRASDRFASLYGAVERHEENIAQKRRGLETADVDGAEALRQVQLQIETLGAERLLKQRIGDEQRVVLDQAELTILRTQAAVSRVQIEWRNVEQRAARLPGSRLPTDLSARLDELEVERERAKEALSVAKSQRKEFLKLFERAEDDLRLVVAEMQRCEGQKEGYLMAYEGDVAVQSRELDRAIFDRQYELANAGRVILELRGEVPVAMETRKVLLGWDNTVRAAALHLETLKVALASMDESGYKSGKGVGIGLILALLAALVLSAWL